MIVDSNLQNSKIFIFKNKILNLLDPNQKVS